MDPNAYSEPSVEVVLSVADLPCDVAEAVRRTQAEDPETLRRILVYGMTRQTIFDTLLSSGWAERRGRPE